MPRLFENINFPKTIAILASVFGIALGLCGLTWMASTASSGGPAQFLIGLGIVELIAMAVSAMGLVVMLILWILSSLLGGFGSGNDPQKLFDGSDDEKK